MKNIKIYVLLSTYCELSKPCKPLACGCLELIPIFGQIKRNDSDIIRFYYWFKLFKIEFYDQFGNERR